MPKDSRSLYWRIKLVRIKVEALGSDRLIWVVLAEVGKV